MQSIYSSIQDNSTLDCRHNSTEQESLSQANQPSELAPILVVIDPKVADYQMLAEAALAQANVIILDPEKDGVEQITGALASYPASALHVVSHGSPGRLQLGNTYLSQENIDRYANELKTWSIFLGSSPVLLYGCQVAAGEVGQNFLARLHELIDTEIAASANLTGSREMDGDWELEVTTGSIEVPLAFPEDVREAYTSVLALNLGVPVVALIEGALPEDLTLGITVQNLGITVPLPVDTDVTLTPDAQLDLGNGAGVPLTVTIAAGTASTALQTIPVLAVDDGIAEGNHTGTITASIVTNNPLLDVIPDLAVTVNINDPLALPQLSITPTNLPITEGTTTSLTVALPNIDLALLPATGVVLTLTPGEDIDLGNGAGVATDITLDANNLSVDLNVTAVDDGLAEGVAGVETSNIDIAFADPALANLLTLPLASVPVPVTDPLALPQLNITPTDLSLTEGLSASLTLGLPDANLPLPAAGLEVILTPGEDIDLGNGAGVAATVTLDANNLNVDLNITAIEDNLEEGLELSNIEVALADPTLASIISLPTTSLPVAINDALVPGVPSLSITPVDLAVVEGDTTSLTIDLPDTLIDLPLISLTLTPGEDLDLGNGAGVATTFELLTDGPTTIDITAVNDGISEEPEISSISLALADPNLANLITLPLTEVSFTVTDRATTDLPITIDTNSVTPISPALIQNPGDIFTVQGTLGEEVVVDFGLSSVDLNAVTEIGVFVVDDISGSIDGILPGEPGYEEAALSRAESIISVLPDTEDLLGDTNLLRELSFPAGTYLGLYLIPDGTAAEALSALTTGQSSPSVFFGTPSSNANATDYLEATGLDDGSFTWTWQGVGSQDFGSLTLTAQATTRQGVSVGTQLQEATNQELIDLTAQAGQTVNATFSTSSDATFDNTMGLYVVENQEGTIIDQLTGATLNPGDVGYAEAVVKQTVVSLGANSSGSQQLQGGFIYATYLIADGDMTEFLDSQGNNSSSAPMAYFGFEAANGDGWDHIKMLGNNTWGVEDVFGGGDKDFNDFVVSFEMSVV
ncbi:MAG: DUF4347 domain-containing protein [Coleofasciculaceae cyanobacterium]